MLNNLESYKNSVEILAKSESNLIFKNSNHQHANIVLTNIIKYSKKTLCIYDDNLSGDIADMDPNFITELTELIKNKGTILKICIKEICKNNNKFQTQVIDFSRKYPGKVKIKIASRQFRDEIIRNFESDLNFAIGDEKMFRLEYGDPTLSERKAICSFNNEEYSVKLSSIFNKYFENLNSIN